MGIGLLPSHSLLPSRSLRIADHADLHLYPHAPHPAPHTPHLGDQAGLPSLGSGQGGGGGGDGGVTSRNSDGDILAQPAGSGECTRGG